MKFTPYPGYVEVEPVSSSNPLASDERKFIEAARVVKSDDSILKVGDIVFFRPHGFFETPDLEGKKHYVLRVHEEFILGKLSEND